MTRLIEKSYCVERRIDDFDRRHLRPNMEDAILEQLTRQITFDLGRDASDCRHCSEMVIDHEEYKLHAEAQTAHRLTASCKQRRSGSCIKAIKAVTFDPKWDDLAKRWMDDGRHLVAPGDFAREYLTDPIFSATTATTAAGGAPVFAGKSLLREPVRVSTSAKPKEPEPKPEFYGSW